MPIARRGDVQLDTIKVHVLASKHPVTWDSEDKVLAADVVRYVLEWWSERAKRQQALKQRIKKR